LIKLKNHRDYFNQLAYEWDSLVTFEPILVQHLQQFGVSSGDHILDIGAGTGRLTKCLAELVGQNGFVIALDFAENMLRIAKSKMITSNVGFVCADVCKLPFFDNQFNKVICFSTFPHVKEKEQSLREMYRMLSQNGKLLILHTQNSQTLNEFHGNLKTIIRHDHIPPAAAMQDIVSRVGFTPTTIIEEKNLYWVEAIK
jgi:demethylmenaquinone methyltransferase/2-methoxy-6-polyprenyl-1,4-benzoquinol methylase